MSPNILEHPLGNGGGAGRWLLARSTAVVLVALWTLLRPLAAASPPDPIWIAGFYDNGDFDEVVTQVGFDGGVSDSSHSPVLCQNSRDWRLTSANPLPVVSASHATLQDRSPPLL